MNPKYKGGPKNGSQFAYMERGRVRIGRNHRPMARLARLAFLARSKDRERRLGWGGWVTRRQAYREQAYRDVDAMFRDMGIEL